MFRLLMELLLFRLVELMLLLDGRRTVLLWCGSSDVPWIDRGWHPRPRHGSGDGESRDGLADRVLRDRSAVGWGCQDLLDGWWLNAWT